MKITLKHKSCYAFAFGLLIGCGSKRDRISEFQIKDHRNAKEELVQEFGQPDSIIALCNKDTAYLFKVENGCVEWRFLANDKIPYKVQINDSCKMQEGEFEVFEYKHPIPRANPKGEDSIGWSRYKNLDSAIRFIAIGHYQRISFALTKSDTGVQGDLFKTLSTFNLESRESTRDLYCKHFGGDYILEYRYQGKVGTVYLGSINFPDTCIATIRFPHQRQL